MICTPYTIFFGCPNREVWDGRGMKHVRGEDRYIQGFGGET
jgi:hypothetical protein